MFVVHQNGGVQSHTKRLRIPGKPQLVPQVLNLYGVRRVRGADLRLSPCFLPTSGKAERAESTRDSVVLTTLSRPLEQEVGIPTNVSESISKRVDQDEFEKALFVFRRISSDAKVKEGVRKATAKVDVTQVHRAGLAYRTTYAGPSYAVTTHEQWWQTDRTRAFAIERASERERSRTRATTSTLQTSSQRATKMTY